MTGVLELQPEPFADDDRVSPVAEESTQPGEVRAALQRLMSADCGVVRDAEGLRRAAETLADYTRIALDFPSRSIESYEVINLLRVAGAIVASATSRTESRGAHTRRDHPDPSDAMLGRFVIHGHSERAFVALPGVVAGDRSS